MHMTMISDNAEIDKQPDLVLSPSTNEIRRPCTVLLGWTGQPFGVLAVIAVLS